RPSSPSSLASIGAPPDAAETSGFLPRTSGLRRGHRTPRRPCSGRSVAAPLAGGSPLDASIACTILRRSLSGVVQGQDSGLWIRECWFESSRRNRDERERDALRTPARLGRARGRADPPRGARGGVL